MIIFLFTCGFFALCAMTMFGLSARNHSTFINALLSVFDHLMNSFSQDDGHWGSVLFYFFTNLLFLLIMSQVG